MQNSGVFRISARGVLKVRPDTKSVCGGGGGGGVCAVVSYPDPDSHSCGWITSPLRGKWPTFHVAVM